MGDCCNGSSTVSIAQAKLIATDFFLELESAAIDDVQTVLEAYCAPQYQCYVSYPWRKVDSIADMADSVWKPVRQSLQSLQRRQDVFFAGINAADQSTWVVSMGHFLGLNDAPLLGIPATRRLAMLRYAE